MEEFGKQIIALNRSIRLWKEAVNEELRLSLRSAVVKDFELAYELSWKAAQELAALEGQKVRKPKEALTFLLDTGVLTDTLLFEAIIDSRNRSVHTYGPAMLDSMLPAVVEDFSTLLALLHDALLRYHSK